MHNNFFTNLVIQTIKKQNKILAGWPVNPPINGANMSFEFKHLSWPAPLLGGLKRGGLAHFATPK
jgi:hypothetical protein